METIQKKKLHAFGKDIYLLGKDKNGIYYWLEAAKWECDWYWGFGYIKSYTNNRSPKTSKDIRLHTHWNYFITGNIEGNYINHINENPNFVEITLTENESWLLSELMESFYILNNTAEFYYLGDAHISTNPLSEVLKNNNEYQRINKELLPKIFEEIYKLLSPAN